MRQLIVAFCYLLAVPAAAQDVATMLRGAAPAVVQVLARRCAGEPERAGSGFVWETSGRVVTALHVVGGCGEITVRFQGLPERSASLERSLIARDLALLRVADPPPVRPLSSNPVLPPVNELVWVYGYGGGSPTREERQLRVTDANREAPLLTQAVDRTVRGELQRLGSPQLDTEILRVEGFLVPGHSGAPVLDSAGRVVGIGSGGLQRGTIGTGWAVRARYLTELAASQDRAAGPGAQPNGALFALVDPSISAELRCGDTIFRRTRNMALGELVAGSDDQLGFVQIAGTSGRTIESFASLRFDIWTEARGGIAVAIPALAKPTPAATYCTVSLGPDRVIEMRFSGSPIVNGRTDPMGSAVQVGQLSQAFFESWAREFYPRLIADTAFTNPIPRPVQGGLLRRAGWYGPGMQGPPAHYIFQTHLAVPEAYVGVAAINRNYMPGTMPPALLEAFATAVFATHLSTLPR